VDEEDVEEEIVEATAVVVVAVDNEFIIVK